MSIFRGCARREDAVENIVPEQQSGHLPHHEKHWESTALDVKPQEQAYWSAIAAKDFSRKPLRSPELKMI